MDKGTLSTIALVITILVGVWVVSSDLAANTAATERNTAEVAELRTEVAGLSVQVESNAKAIAELNARMTNLESRMDGLDERLSVLETRVAELYGLLWAHIGGHRHTNQVADASEGESSTN